MKPRPIVSPLAFALLLLLLLGCATDDPDLDPSRPQRSQHALATDCAHAEDYELEGVGGAQFNFLTVDATILPMADVGKTLANDQIHMLRLAEEQGLTVLDKHVPAFVVFDQTGNVAQVHSGGFYQCATFADCRGYLDDVVGGYTLGGVAFTDRPEFGGTFEGHAYEVLGAAQFRPIEDDYAIRIRRWRVRSPSQWDPRGFLDASWRTVMREEACRRGIVSQAHLLWSEEEQVVAEVLVGARVDPPPGDPTPYFLATFGALASQPSLDPRFDVVPLDRMAPPLTETYLVLHYWPGAFEPGHWPNSPSVTPGGPLPEPYCGDGSCNATTSHVEDAASCAIDCAPGCGDGSCVAGESATTCAIDCRP